MSSLACSWAVQSVPVAKIVESNLVEGAPPHAVLPVEPEVATQVP
jgi:hypothetical protein